MVGTKLPMGYLLELYGDIHFFPIFGGSLYA